MRRGDRIVDDAGCHRVEVHVRNDLPEIFRRIDNSCPISTLPEPSEVSLTPVEFSRNLGLKTLHRTPKRDRAGLHHQMVMVTHQTPGEHPPIVKITNLPDGFNELF
jgi:hypothetical protein